MGHLGPYLCTPYLRSCQTYRANLKSITKGTQSISKYVITICILCQSPCGSWWSSKPEDFIGRVLEGRLINTEFQFVVDYANDQNTLITFDELHEKLFLKEGTLSTTSTQPHPSPCHGSRHCYPSLPLNSNYHSLSFFHTKLPRPIITYKQNLFFTSHINSFKLKPI